MTETETLGSDAEPEKEQCETKEGEDEKELEY